MQPQGQVNFNVIGEAFNIVTKTWQPFVIAGLLAAVAMGVVTIAMYFLVIVGLVIGSGGSMIMSLIGSALMIVAVFAVMAIFQAGLYNMALKASRGEAIEVNDVFFALKNPGPYLIAGLVVGIAIAIGAIFCYIPGLIIGGLTMFTILFIVDKGMAPMDAFNASINSLKSQWLMAALFFIVCAFIGQIGAIACYVGMFFTLPVTYVCHALCYRDVVLSGPVPPSVTESPV